MTAKTAQQLFLEPISGHAFNHDMSAVVVSNSTQNTHVMKRDADGKYQEDVILKEHLERVTSVDWAPKTNRIVTCGGDRNAYVWNYSEETGEWKPCLVLLRINRAATYVRWSPNEDRFAVGSGARLLSVCYFDPQNNWWVSKHIKKPIRSTILCIDWHPCNYLLAIGACDFKARVFSSALKELNDKPVVSAWMPKLSKFGTLLAEFEGTKGWVHGVKFSPSGNLLAWVGHDSSVNVVNSESQDKVMTLLISSLPFVSVLWLTEQSFVCAGHNNFPALYNVSGENIVFGARLDIAEKKGEQNISAMARFRKMDKQGTDKQDGGSAPDTTHVNAITEIRATRVEGGCVKAFSTSGKDGKLVLWEVDALCASIEGLTI